MDDLGAVEHLDLVDGGDNLPAVESVEGTPGFVNASVKMKLNTFTRDGKDKAVLTGRLNRIVKDGNVLLAEAYAFANFHVLRLLTADLAVPTIDRSFYYRCLLAVGDVVCKASTLDEEFRESLRQFDLLRPAADIEAGPSVLRKKSGFHTNPTGRTKVDLKEYNQMIASLSIQMATMASNHLLTNLNKRLEGFLSWKHPIIRRFHKAIARAVLITPDVASEKILEASSLYKSSKKPKKERKKKQVFSQKEEQLQKTRAANAEKEAAHRRLAGEVVASLRELLPLKKSLKFATQAHQSLKLYFWLLKETEDGAEAHKAFAAAEELRLAAAGEAKLKPSARCFKGRAFNLLPIKGAFTTSSIPISSMFFVSILKSLGLSDHNGDGRHLDARKLWDKFFCIKLVETCNRKFAESITTDGYAVSALVSCRQNMDVRKGHSDSSIEDVRQAIESCEAAVRYGGVDPGFSDVVACSFNDGTFVSYSSSRYYEKARIKYSGRKTTLYNEKKKGLTDGLLAGGGSRTASTTKMEEHLRTYLSVLSEVLDDRMVQKYRKMRFLRHVSKQKAVREIVDLLVGDPKDKVLTVIGFGDWSGGSKSPVSRKHSGPIQLIKEKIGRRPNARIVPVDEYLSSQLDSNMWTRLRNMKAKTTVRKTRDGGKVVMRNQKVHKVLHCKPSEGEKLCPRRETTWNRDYNASKNILMLLRMEIKGYERPAPFRRPDRSTKTNHGLEAAQVQGDVHPLHTSAVILAPPFQGTTEQKTTEL